MKKILLVLCLLAVSACGRPVEVDPDDQPTNDEKVETKETIVSFSGVGDNLIHETIYLDAYKDGVYDFKEMYTSVSQDMKNSDIAFINQETIIGGTELGLSGYPSFNSPSEIAQNLKDCGFNLINLASNHSLDRNTNGIKKELENFDQVGDMVVDGIYTSQEDFDRIVTFEVKGIMFSFLAYTYGTNGISPEHSYNVSYFDEAQIKKEVAAAKEISDVVIVSAHWGDENTFKPNDFQKRYAQLFADLEVDVVIGTHPHVIQPIEWITGKNGNETLVVYSLGNFIGGMLTIDNAIGGMIQFDFVKKEEDITVENVVWTPLMIHFEGNQNNIYPERYNYKSYKASEYTSELANKHVLNGYNGNTVSLDYINSVTQNVIDSEYLK